jgi:hypothetical protein
MLANHCNLATKAIAAVFLFVRDDIINEVFFPTDPCEHTFEGWCS